MIIFRTFVLTDQENRFLRFCKWNFPLMWTKNFDKIFRFWAYRVGDFSKERMIHEKNVVTARASGKKLRICGCFKSIFKIWIYENHKIFVKTQVGSKRKQIVKYLVLARATLFLVSLQNFTNDKILINWYSSDRLFNGNASKMVRMQAPSLFWS